MKFEIIGDVDTCRLYATGSFTKFMTTFVCLSLLADKYDLDEILDDDGFLNSLCHDDASSGFLKIFQRTIGSKFSIRDVCSFYNGLPYTFDITKDEIEDVERGEPLKHHCLMNEEVFLARCRHYITQVDPNHCKFHYSELAIIFIGYFLEKVYGVSMEELYQKYVVIPFQLKSSFFARTMPANVYIQDLSPQYDYPSIAIADHGYFSYSNGFFTTLADQQKLLDQLIDTPVFAIMSDINHARAASNTIMNGMTVELRVAGDDLLFGYEGLSYSGCNIWAYSTKFKKGYVTTTNDEDKAYDIYQKFGYDHFDKAPAHTQKIYHTFLETFSYEYEDHPIPKEFVGSYQRVNINDSTLDIVFAVGERFIEIRNPEMVKYDVLYDHGTFRIACKDHMHGTKVGLSRSKKGNHYMYFDGTLYRKIVS